MPYFIQNPSPQKHILGEIPFEIAAMWSPAYSINLFTKELPLCYKPKLKAQMLAIQLIDE